MIFGSDRSSRSYNVCLSVCLFGTLCSRAVNLHHSRSESNKRPIDQSETTQRALREHSDTTQRALREYSESIQSIKIRVIQSEPLNTASCSQAILFLKF